MRILFLHTNYPAQFGAIAERMARAGADVVFATSREDPAPPIPGVKIVPFKPHREVNRDIHPYAGPFEKAVLNGQAVARAGMQLKAQGFTPDVVIAHSGWGPGLYVKDVWPLTKLIGYYEWYYRPNGVDTVFLNDASPSDDELLRARSRNAPILMDLAHGDWGICPTNWQLSTFPEQFRGRMTVQHDGVDTDYYAPQDGARLALPDLDLSDVDELITYVARGMEPYRGFPQFMAALERVLRKRPNAHAVIVGADRVAYGAQLKDGESYKDRALRELDLDLSRVHFTGLLPRGQYRDVLRASSVHVYLTVPFVLSWSMMEAMSTGCLLIASDTAPVREVATHGETALLTDFFDTETLADVICDTLADPDAHAGLRQAARRTIAEHYALRDLVSQKKLLIDAVAQGLLGA